MTSIDESGHDPLRLQPAMPRSDLHTAFGGTVLGMSLPLAGLGVTLQAGGAGTLGFELSGLDVMLPVMTALSALLLFVSGALLLWGDALSEPPRRPVPVKQPRTHTRRMRPVQRAWAPPRRVPVVPLAVTPIRRAPALPRVARFH